MTAPRPGAGAPRMVFCQKLQKTLPGLDAAPWPGALGQRIYEHISAEAWHMWEERMKMILNEYRLMPWQKERRRISSRNTWKNSSSPRVRRCRPGMCPRSSRVEESQGSQGRSRLAGSKGWTEKVIGRRVAESRSRSKSLKVKSKGHRDAWQRMARPGACRPKPGACRRQLNMEPEARHRLCWSPDGGPRRPAGSQLPDSRRRRPPVLRTPHDVSGHRVSLRRAELRWLRLVQAHAEPASAVALRVPPLASRPRWLPSSSV